MNTFERHPAASVLLLIGALTMASPAAWPQGPQPQEQSGRGQSQGQPQGRSTNGPQGEAPGGSQRSQPSGAAQPRGSAPSGHATGQPASGSHGQSQGGGASSAPSQSHSGQAQGHNASYTFAQQDRAQLRAHYQRVLGNVNPGQRPALQQGQRIPQASRPYLTPAPESLRHRLPPPPSGYVIAYYQGFTVVYDPETFLIISLGDLLAR